MYGSNPNAVDERGVVPDRSNLPVLFMPDYDYMLAVDATRSAGRPTSCLALTAATQYYPQYWYVKQVGGTATPWRALRASEVELQSAEQRG